MKVVIVPYCDDLNRGDQALVWESRNVFSDICKNSTFSLISTSPYFEQTKKEGIEILDPILKHPSRFIINRKSEYGLFIKVCWGLISLYDLFVSLLLCSNICRKVFSPFFPRKLRYSIHSFEAADLVVVKGGGFIHSYGANTDIYLMYYSLYHIIFALKLKKRVVVMPNSFGPLKNKHAKRIAESTLKKCQLIMTRESVSNVFLNSIGIKNFYYPDLGFYLRRNNNLEVPFFVDKTCIAFTVRPYRFPGFSNSQQKFNDYIDSIAALAKHVYSRGYLPVFVEHTLATNYHENDFECIRLVTSKLKSNEFKVVSNRDYNCKDLKMIYSKFHCIIGTRFHSVIFSLSEGVPAIAIAYGGNKALGIMKDIGLSEYCIPIEESNTISLINIYQSLEDNYETYRSKVQEINSSMKQKRVEMISVIKDELDI